MNSREVFVITESIKSAARCANTMYCGNKQEKEYTIKEEKAIAKALGDDLSLMQLDSLLLITKLAILHKE